MVMQLNLLSGKGRFSASATAVFIFNLFLSRLLALPSFNIFSLISLRMISPDSPTKSDIKIDRSPVPPATSKTESPCFKLESSIVPRFHKR